MPLLASCRPRRLVVLPLAKPRRPAWLVWALTLALLALPSGTADRPAALGGPALFEAKPVLDGVVVSNCGGTSPQSNACNAGVSSEACGDGCAPNAFGGLGFTGTSTSMVWGKDRDGADKYVSYSCSFVAGSQTSVFGASTGSCWGGSNAAYECNRDPQSGKVVCGYFLWPPFRLVGTASGGLGGPVGSWRVTLER